MKRLTEAHRAAYDTQGYLAPIDALAVDEAAECRRRLEIELARTGGRPDTRLRNNTHLLLRWAAELVRDPRVVDVVEDVLGPDLLVLRSTLFVKAPSDSGYVAWHHDLAYWELSSERMVTAWIALTDSTTANACVRVVPGSHREPVLPHRLGRDPNNRLVRGQLVAAEIAPERVACIELRAGQLALHHGRTLHSSPANPSGALRAGLAVRYISPDVRQGGPRPSATLVRGRDTLGYYDHEPAPRFDYDPVARRWHTRTLRRYAAHVFWQALREPSLDHFAVIGRMASRLDMLRALIR
jgi:ectoine hydroxylase-related dioxygenase (phytanoyl-CoA dioxygenase family)